jgi:hypothetical protein
MTKLTVGVSICSRKGLNEPLSGEPVSENPFRLLTLYRSETAVT